MNFHPKVSIIIPVYNGSKYLGEAIDSALAQTYSKLEVLVVNDGSNDAGKTSQIARSYGERIRYFEKENGGVATALNLGIRNMTGVYFSWLSHDDMYYPHKIDAQMRYMQQYPQAILYSDYDVIDAQSVVIAEERTPSYAPERFLYELIQTPFLHGCTLLIPKVCFETVGVFNEHLRTTQDYELWIKMAQVYQFIHLPEKLIQSRHHDEQGIHQVKTLHQQEVEELNLWFLKTIVPDKIPSLYHIPAFEFYFNLARAYQKRQLFRSSQVALTLSLRLAWHNGLVSYGKMLARTMRYVFASSLKHVLHRHS